MWDAVLARFVAEAPVAVMARLAIQRALSAEWVNALFEQHRTRQYTRELLFSTVVDLMELVALGLRPSLHAAAQRALATGELGVSLQALYDKVNHAEPAVLRALVQGSATRLAPVRTALLAPGPAPAALLPGYRLRVFDGNHLPASEKRVKPLRGRRAAALPGQTLVVYDPDLDLVVDLIAGEDAVASERTLVPAAVTAAGPGELWVGDRNFSTRPILTALVARGAAVLVREHGTQPHPTPLGARRRVGRGETGVVYEQAVAMPTDPASDPAGGLGAVLRLRRVEVELDTPTTDGDTLVRLLTTLLAADADARTVAALYLRRWTVEGLFGRLEAVLASEIRTLGQPRAALLAFSVAVVAYNVLAVVQATLEAEAARQATAAAPPAAAPVPISLFYVAHEVRAHYRGMLIAVAAAVWSRYDAESPTQLAETLRHLATHVRLEAFRKHPRPATPKPKKGYAPRREVQRTVATARVLADQKKQKRHPRTP
jgi:IS4 transposase